jgi:ribonucleoside-diphosphate reductase alpha chain
MLPAGGSCLLGALNLAAFVVNGQFDTVEFYKAVSIAVEALNSVLDEGLKRHPLEEQQRSVGKWRQIGLGIMGLADALIKMGVKYGSEDAVKLCDDIGHALARQAICSSAQLAYIDGAYEEYNDSVMDTPFFIKHWSADLADIVMNNGLRNSQLLTIAPTGSISSMIGVSGGIEPIFANSYTRTTKSLHGQDVTYKVYTPIVEEYMSKHNITDEKDLPEFFVTSADISVDERIAMQGIWQNHIDASISSTVNLPEEATVEDVKRIYMQAWKKGLKGITVYRAGCARTAILNASPENKKSEEPHITNGESLPRGVLLDVPDDLTYRKYKLCTGCGKLYLFVGVDNDGIIYDVFTNTDGVGGCTINTQANSRLLSACIRSGVPIEHIIEQLEKSGTCPSFQYARGQKKTLSKGKSCPSAIANVLKNILVEAKEEEEEIEETEAIAPKKILSHNICPDCGAELVHENGCNSCKICGWSKCSV